MVFQISTIGINDFSNVFFTIEPLPLNEWFVAHRVTIDIDGLSMVLVKVNKKRPKRKKT